MKYEEIYVLSKTVPYQNSSSAFLFPSFFFFLKAVLAKTLVLKMVWNWVEWGVCLSERMLYLLSVWGPLLLREPRSEGKKWLTPFSWHTIYSFMCRLNECVLMHHSLFYWRLRVIGSVLPRTACQGSCLLPREDRS